MYVHTVTTNNTQIPSNTLRYTENIHIECISVYVNILTYTNTHIHSNTLTFTQIHSNTVTYTQIHSNTLKYGGVVKCHMTTSSATSSSTPHCRIVVENVIMPP